MALLKNVQQLAAQESTAQFIELLLTLNMPEKQSFNAQTQISCISRGYGHKLRRH
eukprot:SAG11_NODE_2138_length_3763_cov_2.690229_6_plen_55_part_00